MSEQRSPVSRVLEEVFGRYVPRFRESLEEVRLLERLFLTTNPSQLLSLEKDDEQKRLRIDALQRMLDQMGYPIFRFGITFVWAEFEAFTDDFLKSWLTHISPPASLDIFDKVAVNQSVRSLERMTPDERTELYVKMLKAKVARGSEIKTFFSALDNLGLPNAEGRKELERSLTELQQIRNVLVHRGGIVDASMLSRCPWLEINPNVKLGKRFPLNTESTSAYTLLVVEAASHVLKRIDMYQAPM